jgi:hypothetical protein
VFAASSISRFSRFHQNALAFDRRCAAQFCFCQFMAHCHVCV